MKLLLTICALGILVLSTGAYAEGGGTGDGILYVISEYATIQAAVDNADDGDTIIVDPGLYDENVDINVKVSIEGAGSGTDSVVDTIIDPSGGSYGMYIHQPVNLMNLRVTGAPSHGIRVEPIVIPLIFSNVTWENIASSANGGRGVELHNNTQITNMAVTNCEFVSNGAQGLRTASNVTVDGMVITDSKFNQNTYGLYLQGTISNVTIFRSTCNNNFGALSDGLPNSHGAYMTETGPLTGLIIEDSEFKNNTGAGLMVWNVQDNADITITGTSFQDNNKWGVLIWGSTLTNVLIEDSSVLTNDGLGSGYYGIDFNTYNKVMTNVAVHYTSISGHGVGGGVKNRNTVDTAIVDATRNWWGSPTGPCRQLPNGKWVGKGDKVTANVDFVPWLPRLP